MDSGGLCVMMAGIQQTLMWPVVSWDIQVQPAHSIAPAFQ